MSVSVSVSVCVCVCILMRQPFFLIFYPMYMNVPVEIIQISTTGLVNMHKSVTYNIYLSY